MPYSRTTFSHGNHEPGDVSSSLSFAPYLSLLEKEPLMSFSLNPMSLDRFQKVLTMPELWCSWGIWIPLCMFPSACQHAAHGDPRVWGCRGEHREASSVASLCSKWWALLICPWGSKNHCVCPPRAISPVEPQLLRRPVLLPCVLLPACLHNQSQNLSNWAFAWPFVKMSHRC